MYPSPWQPARQAQTTDDGVGVLWQILGPGWWWGGGGVGTEGEPELHVLGAEGKPAAWTVGGAEGKPAKFDTVVIVRVELALKVNQSSASWAPKANP